MFIELIPCDPPTAGDSRCWWRYIIPAPGGNIECLAAGKKADVEKRARKTMQRAKAMSKGQNPSDYGRANYRAKGAAKFNNQNAK